MTEPIHASGGFEGGRAPAALTARQLELARLLAALIVADYRAFPPASDNSPPGPDRAAPSDDTTAEAVQKPRVMA